MMLTLNRTSPDLTLLTVVLLPGCLATKCLRFEVVGEICGNLHSHRSQARSLWFKELAVLVMTCVYDSYSHLRSSSRRDTENPSENKTGPCL